MSSVLNVLIAVCTFIISIAILITVHEFGHFWVARRFGIKVLRFSIGFGKPLLRWYDKLGTEYVIAAIPLGGYVSMLGERGTTVVPIERHMAYSEKPVAVRMAVLLAGPLFNLLFAILAFWLVFFSGISVMAPILGTVPKGTPAEVAGLKSGQEIVSVEGQRTPSWDAVKLSLLHHLGDERILTLETRGEPPLKHLLDISHVRFDEHQKNTDFLEELGLVPLDPFPAIVGALKPESPAEKAGLKIGDRIIAINGKSYSSRSEISHFIQAHSGVLLNLSVVRNDKTYMIPVKPINHREEDGKMIGLIGVEYTSMDTLPKDYIHLERYDVLESFLKAYERTRDYTVLTLEMVKKMILGVASSKHLSGPIAIAKYAGQSFRFGFEYFLSFLAVISISLGVFNLLPIPLLDGGHLMYCIVEIIIGRPISDQAQAVGLWLGGLFLVGVTLLAFYNDLAY